MAEAIVSIVVGRLNDLLMEEPQLLGGLVGDEIQQVVTKLMWIKTFLHDADSKIDERRICILLAEIREIAYHAEHVVENFLVKASFSTAKTKQWINTYKFSKKVKDIQKKMSVISNRFNDYNIRSTSESSTSSYVTPAKLKRFYSYTTVEPEIFVGFQKDLDLLVGHLVDESDESYPLISICGMGGLGKTTLAEKIYNHPTIKSHFPGLAWVSISQKWQTKSVLQRILICLVHEDKDEILTWNDDKLAERLLQIQQQKKCLIVLDDIWSTDAWDSLKAAFPVEKSISKLMLTTRNDGVAEHVNSKGLVHRPICLTPDQSWELLQKKALPSGDYLESTRDVKKMEELGRKMVAKCAGLPLAIVILGGILVTKPTTSEWEKVYHDIQSSLKKGEGLGEVHQRQLFEVLVWSYSNLPTQLKPCFLYIGKFGEDEWVSTKKLYQLWIAEGMVLSSDRREGETMMQVAESYLGELVHKNMVQVRSSDVQSPLAKFVSCSLHDLMRDLSHFQAKAEDFYEVIELGGGNDFYVNPDVGLKAAGTQQLVVYFNEGCTRKKTITYFAKQVNELQYRSMLMFGKFPLTPSVAVSDVGNGYSVSDVGNVYFIINLQAVSDVGNGKFNTYFVKQMSSPSVAVSDVGRFKLLRVCALEDVQLDQSTLFNINGGVLGGLIYLRYLSVLNRNFMNFPSIQKSVLLQTLRLHGDLYFPAWMSKNVLGKLKRLRHLYLPRYWEVKGFIGKNSKLRFDGLSKLETLENFNTEWCEVKDLPKLTSLQRLYLIVKGSIYDFEEMIKNLSALALSSSSSSSCLKELGIRIYVSDDMRLGSGPDMLRKLMSDQKYTLRDMRLRGKIPELGELFMQQEQQLNNNNNTHHHLLLTDVSLLRITRLDLIDTHLEEDPMPYLEKIPTLSYLCLENEAYVGNEMVCSATGGGFPKLKYLILWGLPFIKKWRVEEGSMPILHNLYIYRCLKLEELPEGLVFLTSLQRLQIIYMPSEFCDRIREVSNNGAQGPEFYKVAHIPSLDIEHPL